MTTPRQLLKTGIVAILLLASMRHTEAAQPYYSMVPKPSVKRQPLSTQTGYILPRGSALTRNTLPAKTSIKPQSLEPAHTCDGLRTSRKLINDVSAFGTRRLPAPVVSGLNDKRSTRSSLWTRTSRYSVD